MQAALFFHIPMRRRIPSYEEVCALLLLVSVLLIGVPVSAALFLLHAALFSAMDLPAQLLPALAHVPVLLGAYLAARFAAKRRRHGGLWCGAQCALLLALSWYTLSDKQHKTVVRKILALILFEC